MMNKWGVLCLLPLAFACNKPNNSGNNGNVTSKNKLTKANLTGAKSLFIAQSKGRGGESQNTSKLYKLVEENGTYKHVEVSFTDELGEVISSNISVSQIFNLEKDFILLVLDNSSTGGNLLLVNKTTGDIFAVPGYYSLYSFDAQPIKTIPGVPVIYLRADFDVARIDYTNPGNPTVEKILSNKGIISGGENVQEFEVDKHGNIFYMLNRLAGVSWKTGGSMSINYDSGLKMARSLDEELFFINVRDTTTTFITHPEWLVTNPSDEQSVTETAKGKAADFILVDGKNKRLDVKKKITLCENTAAYHYETINSEHMQIPHCQYPWIKDRSYKSINIKSKNAIILYNISTSEYTKISAFPLFRRTDYNEYILEEIPTKDFDFSYDYNVEYYEVIDDENGLIWQVTKNNITLYLFDVENKRLIKRTSPVQTSLTRAYQATSIGDKKIQVTGLLSDKDARVIIEIDENLNQKVISEIELNAEIVNLIKLN